MVSAAPPHEKHVQPEDVLAIPLLAAPQDDKTTQPEGFFFRLLHADPPLATTLGLSPVAAWYYWLLCGSAAAIDIFFMTDIHLRSVSVALNLAYIACSSSIAFTTKSKMLNEWKPAWNWHGHGTLVVGSRISMVLASVDIGSRIYSVFATSPVWLLQLGLMCGSMPGWFTYGITFLHMRRAALDAVGELVSEIDWQDASRAATFDWNAFAFRLYRLETDLSDLFSVKECGASLLCASLVVGLMVSWAALLQVLDPIMDSQEIVMRCLGFFVPSCLYAFLMKEFAVLTTVCSSTSTGDALCRSSIPNKIRAWGSPLNLSKLSDRQLSAYHTVVLSVLTKPPMGFQIMGVTISKALVGRLFIQAVVVAPTAYAFLVRHFSSSAVVSPNEPNISSSN